MAKRPTKNVDLDEAIAKESSARVKSIDNVSNSIVRFKSEMDDRILEVEQMSNTKGINQLSSSLTKVLSKLGDTVGALASGTKAITIGTALAAKDSISQYGKAISEDISINKQNTVAMALSRTTPLYGYFAAKFMETDVFRKASDRIRTEIGGALSTVATKFKGAMSSGALKVKSMIGGVGRKASDVKEKITNRKAPPEEKRASEVDAALSARTKSAREKQNKEALITAKVEARLKNLEKSVPSMAVGGVVEKTGLIKAHAGEAVVPIEKLLNQIDKAHDTSKMQGAKMANFLDIMTRHSDRLEGYMLKEVQVNRKMIVTDFFSQLKGMKKAYLDSKTDISRAILDLRNKLVGMTSHWTLLWQRMLIRHPVMRFMYFFAKDVTRLFKTAVMFPFKSRGGYKAQLPKGSNTFGNLTTILGMIYAQGMYKMDVLIKRSEESLESIQRLVSGLTGELLPKMEAVSTGQWTIAQKALRAIASPIEYAVKKTLPESIAETLTKKTTWKEIGGQLGKGIGVLSSPLTKGMSALKSGAGSLMGAALPESVLRRLEDRKVKQLAAKERKLLEAKANKSKNIVDALWELVGLMKQGFELDRVYYSLATPILETVSSNIGAIGGSSQRSLPRGSSQFLLGPSSEEGRLSAEAQLGITGRRGRRQRIRDSVKGAGRKFRDTMGMLSRPEEASAKGSELSQKYIQSISLNLSKMKEKVTGPFRTISDMYKNMKERNRYAKKSYFTLEGMQGGINRLSGRMRRMGKNIFGWVLGIGAMAKSFLTPFLRPFMLLPRLLISLLGPVVTLAAKGARGALGLAGRAAKGAGGLAAKAGRGLLGLGKAGLARGGAAGVGGILAGGAMTLWDAFKGVGKADEWLGKDGEKVGIGGKILSGISGAIGGTGKGVKGAAAGALKGATLGAGIGSMIPVVGTIIGGVVGALAGGVAGAVGGENIAKGVKAAWEKAKPLAEKLVEFIQWPFKTIASLAVKARDYVKEQWNAEEGIIGIAKKVIGFITWPTRMLTSTIVKAKDLVLEKWNAEEGGGVSGIVKKVVSFITWPTRLLLGLIEKIQEKIKDKVGGIVSKVGSFFGIGDEEEENKSTSSKALAGKDLASRIQSKMSPGAIKLLGTKSEGIMDRYKELQKSGAIVFSEKDGKWLTTEEMQKKSVSRGVAGLSKAQVEPFDEGTKSKAGEIDFSKYTLDNDWFSDPKDLPSAQYGAAIRKTGALIGHQGEFVGSPKVLADVLEKGISAKTNEILSNTQPFLQEISQSGPIISRAALAVKAAADSTLQAQQIAKAATDSSKEMVAKMAEINKESMGDVISNVTNMVVSSNNTMAQTMQNSGANNSGGEIDPFMGEILRNVLHGNLS